MALNAGIILGGQPVNILGAMNEGRAMAESQIAMNRQNALAELYRTQGAGIAAGDQNALNALAGMDPMASLGVQDARLGMDQTRLGMDATRLGMDATRQDMQFSAEKMAMLREESKREAAAALAEQAATLSAEQLAAEQAALSDALSGGAFFYQNKDKAGYDNFLASKGIDPAEFPFEAFPAHAAAVEGVLDAYKTFAPAEAPKPQSGAGKLAADLAAGVITQEQYNAELARTAPKGSRISMDPTTGAMTIEEGVGVGASEATVGQAYNPNEIQSVLGMIDAIAQDPSLESVVGNKALVLGGGNDIKDLNMAQRLGYGKEGLDVIEKIGQLQSNAWLSARAMLKGGGAITDYESRKAEAAVARLERPKSAEDFKAALKELRDAITEGEAKLRAAKGGAPAPAASASPSPTAPVGDFATMGLAEIGQVDIGSLTPEQMDALEARMTELGL